MNRQREINAHIIDQEKRNTNGINGQAEDNSFQWNLKGSDSDLVNRKNECSLIEPGDNGAVANNITTLKGKKPICDLQASSEPDWSISPFYSNLELTDNLTPQFPVHLLNSYDSFHRTLMADIDIHMELENYIKAVYCNQTVTQESTDGGKASADVLSPDGDTVASDGSNTWKDHSSIDHFNIPLTVKSQPRFFSPDETIVSFSQIDSFNETRTKRETLKRIKSESDRDDGENVAFEGYIKRTYGKTSFQLHQNKYGKSIVGETSEENWRKFLAELKLPVINVPLFDQYQNSNELGGKLDCFRSTPGTHIVKAKSRTKGKIIYGATDCSEITHDSRQIQTVSSVEELLKMYNRVLRERKRNLEIQQQQSNRKGTDSLLSFIDILLRAKKNDSDTIKIPEKTSQPSFHHGRRLHSALKCGIKQNKAYLTLEEYVNMVQKMLSSALSIQQITMLNDITARLGGKPPIKTSNGIRPTKKDGKLASNKKLKQTITKGSSLPQKTAPSQISRNIRKTFQRVKIERKKTTSSPKSSLRATRSQEGIIDEDDKSLENIKTLELSSPEVLKSFLKSSFRLRKNAKLLVTVRLTGDKIVVNAVSKIHNETVHHEVYQSKETSDLIIESVHGEQLDRLLFGWEHGKDVTQKNHPNPNPSFLQKTLLKKKSSLMAIDLLKPDVTTHIRRQINARKKSRERTPSLMPIGDFTDAKNALPFPPTPVEPLEPATFNNPYEYDQEKLKVQHPIEAIMESSESKTDETLGETPSPFRSQCATLKPSEKAATGPKETTIPDDTFKFSGNIMRNPGKLNRTMSHVLKFDSTESDLGRENAKKSAKSLEDTSFRKTLEKINFPRRSPRQKVRITPCDVLCYLISKKSNDKRIKGKKSSAAANDPKSECGGPNKKTVKRSRVTLEKTKFPARENGNQSQRRTPNSRLENPWQDRWTPDRQETRSDDGTVEFLYNDHIRSSSNMSQESSESDEPQKFHKTNASTAPHPTDRTDTKHFEKRSPSDDSKELPVFIHTPKTDSFQISFPSLMIRSDSFLKSQSTFALTKSKIKSLFKSNSDIKFVPGRATEAGAQPQTDQTPFVTFVLTPKQKAAAGIPSNQVQVVLEKNTYLNKDKSLDVAEPDRLIEHQKKNLRSIEEFIQTLSKCIIKDNMKRAEKSSKGEADEQRKRAQTVLNNPKPVQGKRYGGRCPRHTGTALNSKKAPRSREGENEDSGRKPACLSPSKVKKLSKTNEVPRWRDSKSVEKEVKKKQVRKDEIELATMPGHDAKKEKVTKSKGKMCKNEKETAPVIVRLLEEVEEVKESSKCQVPVTTPSAQSVQTNKRESDQTEIARQTRSKVFPNGDDEHYSVTQSKRTSEDTSKGTQPAQSPSNKKIRSYTIKISCNPKKSHSDEVNLVMKEMQGKRERSLQRTAYESKEELAPVNTDTDSRILDKLIGKKVSLERTPSIYFDAEESEAEPVWRKNRVPQGISNDAFSIEDTTTVTPPSPPLKNETGSDVEEKILDKIMENLQLENVQFAIFLLETFFNRLNEEETKKTGREDTPKIYDVINSIEDKSKNLMESMEKNGWLKVLSLLDETTAIFSSKFQDQSTSGDLSYKIMEPKMSASLEYLENQVLNAGKLMTAIQTLMDKNFPTDEESFGCKTVSSNLLSSPGNSFQYLKNKIVSTSLKLNRTEEEDPMDVDLRESNTDRKLIIQSLKKQVRQKRLRLQYLMNVGGGSISPEVQRLKLEAAGKLKLLEKSLSNLEEAIDPGKTSQGTSLEAYTRGFPKFSLRHFGANLFGPTRESSLVNLATTCKNYIFGFHTVSESSRSAETGETEDGGIQRKPSLFGSLMRIWNGNKRDDSSFHSSDVSN